MRHRKESNIRTHRFSRSHQSPAAISNQAPVIETIEELRAALQEAIALEHFTIPPYLCALYSIRKGANPEATRIIQTVVIEEMGHMIMAANILNAIGGKPRIFARESLPEYPREMPHSAIGFEVGLLKFSKNALNTFLRIERPAEERGPTEPGQFWSIGEFYAAVSEALNRLDSEAKSRKQKKGIFTGCRPQVTNEHYHGSRGKVIAVYSIEDANEAIKEIVDQGEGKGGSIKDGDDDEPGDESKIAHYYRFNEIFFERRYRTNEPPDEPPSGDPLPVDWNAVYNMMPNPNLRVIRKESKLKEPQRSQLLGAMEEFNRTYSSLLRNIQRGCNGKPEVLREGVPMMHSLREMAIDLMRAEVGIGNYTAGPSFEYVP
ncbi:MAG: hypothetical protein C5B50_05690 [Verrucomicrobia bacterium]|nr:MAG: hypothetical protein C5B50_05690 [Verrucomicrobiota bacterium]